MFPGQGSQYPGMAAELLKEFPYAARVYEEASEVIKVDLRKMCLSGSESELKETANTQPAILVTSIATWSVLREEAGFQPALFAGHSLGEYSALVAAGRLDLSAAARIVRRRGEAMQRAVPQGVGAMAAVLQLSATELEKLCEQASQSPGEVVEVANYNSNAQLVVAGHKVAVDRLAKLVGDLGKRVVMLPVSAPFHSSLMQPAKDEMAPILEQVTWRRNSTEVYANVSGEIVSHEANHLIDQIASPVLWTQSVLDSFESQKAVRQVEVGPGSVLCGLSRRIVPKNSVELLTTNGADLTATLKKLG